MPFAPDTLAAVFEAEVPAATRSLAVALSGGRDSAALLAAVQRLGFRGLPLRAVHVDHGLQPAAEELRRACLECSRRLGVPLTVLPVAVDLRGGVSVEEAAREARYLALAAQLTPAECLLTAHHAEDQAETLLLQLLRGAGLEGLAGMPRRRPLGLGWHLRPLLGVGRDELRAFGAAAQVVAVEDPMNEDRRFDRNYLRAAVWPALAARWPAAAATLARTAGHLAAAQARLDALAAGDLARLRDGDALSVPGLRGLTHDRRVDALRCWLRERGVRPPPAARLQEALRQALAAGADHQPTVAWGEHALRRYRDRLFLTARRPPRLGGPFEWWWGRDARLDIGSGLGTLRMARCAQGPIAEDLAEPLIVRRRQGGERLRAAPRARTQSAQHLMQQQGVLPWMRDAVPMVFAQERLLAIGDTWVDAHRRGSAGAPGWRIAWEDGPRIV